MSDFEPSSQVTSKLMDDTGSLVTVVSFQEDNNRVTNNNVSIRPAFDLVGMGVSFEPDEPEGVDDDNNGGGGGGGRLVELCPPNCESQEEIEEDEESILDIPDLSKSCGGLPPPRTIPFRSASFSQVDVTSDGKHYVRNCRSPITLKPTAFCLLNNTAAAASPGTSQKGSGVGCSATIPQQGEKSSMFPIIPNNSESSPTPSQPIAKSSEKTSTRKYGMILSSPPMYTSPIQNQLLQEKGNEEEKGIGGGGGEPAQGEGEDPPQILCNESDSSVVSSVNNHKATNNLQLLDTTSNKVPAPTTTVLSAQNFGQSVDENGGENINVNSNTSVNTSTTHTTPPSSIKDCGRAASQDEETCEDNQIRGHNEMVVGVKSRRPVKFYLGSEPSEDGKSHDMSLGEELLSPNEFNVTGGGGGGESNTIMLEEGEGQVPRISERVDQNAGDIDYSKNRNENVSNSESYSGQESSSSPRILQTQSNFDILSPHDSITMMEQHADDNKMLVDTSSLNAAGGFSIMKSLEQELNFPGLVEVTTTSRGDEDEKNPLLRQPSGQSDGSDEILPVRSLFTSSNSELCASSPPSDTDISRPHPFSGLHSRAQSESTPAGFSIPGSTLAGASGGMFCGVKKEISRANSVSCSAGGNDVNNRPLPPRRYKDKIRPLRGPYGQMLEAEMNKLIPVRSSLRDYDNSDFCRESKSSSPNRSLHSSLTNVDPEQQPKNPSLASSNTLLMASMDDLHFSSSQSKAFNHRRKISTQLPIQNAHFPGETASTLAFHQRTASSPSQLLHSTSTDAPSSQEPETRRRYLDGSPRGHVLAEVVETEKSYVDSLRILVKKYMEPLKSLDFIDAGLVDEIFFQIPKILWHHESLLDALQKRVTDDMQCVGDVLLETFRQNSLLECYSLFVNNWKNAKGSLKMAVASKPPFARFLEDNARQHKGKLTLDSLLIMPIQRIPRYELLVKELLKHTDPSHEDHSRLTFVLDNIKQFAIHIDCASVDPNDNREIEIEGWASGLGHLVRQDIVTLCTNSNVKKERALFLFADSLVIASIKRKSTMRKPSSSTSHSTGNSWDGCKFKLLMKIPLMDVHLHDGTSGGTTDRDRGSTAMTTTSNKSTSSSSSSSSAKAGSGSGGGGGGGGGSCGTGSSSGGGGGGSSNEETDDLKIIHRMMELATMLKCSHAGLDELLKDLLSGLKHHGDNGDSVDFLIKTSDNSDSPEVLKILFGSVEKKSGWLESFSDALGKFIRYGFGKLPQVQFLQALPIRKTRAGLQLSCAAPVFLHNKVSKMLEMSDVWLANSDGYVGQICILTLHPEPAITSCNGVCNSRITCIISVPPPILPQTQPLHPSLAHHHPHDDQHQQHPHLHSLGYESEDESHRNRQGHKTTEQWSVWLGTEDGGLHVYDCSDSVRVKKNRHKIQHSAPLHCIVYFDSRVFVSLGNGDVAVYSRNTSGHGWSIASPCWVTIGSAINPVTKMTKVRSQVWCACGSQMKVYGENAGMLELQQSIAVTVEGSNLARGISCIVASEELVWVAVQGTSILKCYNNTSFECLFETNVSLDVSKILAGCDDIIRQHKSACLRITALLLSPDKTLWVGTSAGVILTVSSANHNYKTSPLCYGHTGQVRFLTCCTSRDSCTVISGGDGYEEFRPMPSLFHTNNNNSSSFGNHHTPSQFRIQGESSVDISGREDSTNHLLIWKIPKPS